LDNSFRIALYIDQYLKLTVDMRSAVLYKLHEMHVRYNSAQKSFKIEKQVSH